MKKKLLLISCLCITMMVSGQKSRKDQGLKLGIKGGLNVSNFIGDGMEGKNNTYRTSVHLGILTEIIVSDKLSVQPELLYSGQGYSGSVTPGFSRSKYNYLNFPVMAKIYITEKLNIEAGPQVGFLLYSKERTDTAIFTYENQKTVDFGMNVGLAYELENGVFFQTRYNLGLSNINSGADAIAKKYSNSVIQLSIGIKL